VRRSDTTTDRDGGLDDEISPDPRKRDPKVVEIAAVRLLARREHSTRELRRKLVSKGYLEETVDTVLQKLAAKRLVSDDRFVSSFVDHHVRRGQGPVRIRAELRQQGLDTDLIEQNMEGAEVDWAARAAAVRRRKFGVEVPRGIPERAKQARFLQYRGFSAEQIRAALNGSPEDGEDDAGNL
jgi:regulatory protein